MGNNKYYKTEISILNQNKRDFVRQAKKTKFINEITSYETNLACYRVYLFHFIEMCENYLALQGCCKNRRNIVFILCIRFFSCTFTRAWQHIVLHYDNKMIVQ